MGRPPRTRSPVPFLLTAVSRACTFLAHLLWKVAPQVDSPCDRPEVCGGNITLPQVFAEAAGEIQGSGAGAERAGNERKGRDSKKQKGAESRRQPLPLAP